MNTPQPRIGWIGTGVMGAAMCGHLVDKGHPVTVHTRSRDKAQSLIDRGAVWADTPAAVSDRSDIVCTIVGVPADVREVYFGSEGVLSGARAGHIFVDFTTTEPALAQAIHAAALERGARAIDAPVSGGDVGARNATLSIMIGGDVATVEELMPLFATVAKRILYQGGPGAGQHTKMCNQIMIAGTMVGMCEALLYAQQAGLQVDTVVETIRGGAAGCWSLDNYGPRILRRDFAPGFVLDHFIKDMWIALAEAQRMHIALPGLALVHQLYSIAHAHGHGSKGTHALMLALEDMSHASG